MSYVVLVLGDDGERQYYTGLRTADDRLYLPQDPFDPWILQFSVASAGADAIEQLEEAGYRAKITELEWEHPFFSKEEPRYA